MPSCPPPGWPVCSTKMTRSLSVALASGNGGLPPSNNVRVEHFDIERLDTHPQCVPIRGKSVLQRPLYPSFGVVSQDSTASQHLNWLSCPPDRVDDHGGTGGHGLDRHDAKILDRGKHEHERSFVQRVEQPIRWLVHKPHVCGRTLRSLPEIPAIWPRSGDYHRHSCDLADPNGVFQTLVPDKSRSAEYELIRQVREHIVILVGETLAPRVAILNCLYGNRRINDARGSPPRPPNSLRDEDAVGDDTRRFLGSSCIDSA